MFPPGAQNRSRTFSDGKHQQTQHCKIAEHPEGHHNRLHPLECSIHSHASGDFKEGDIHAPAQRRAQLSQDAELEQCENTASRQQPEQSLSGRHQNAW